ncbi:MAG: hypothetical protein ACR2QF_08735 [Geminicoccaceae bacterium]
MDLRERLIAAVECGMSRRSVAKLLNVAPSMAIKWVDQNGVPAVFDRVHEAATIAPIASKRMPMRS